MNWIVELQLPILAAMLGFVLARSNSCTVRSVHRLVRHGKADWLLGLGCAAAVAGLVLGVLTTYDKVSFILPLHMQLSWLPVLGGVIMGIGSLANRACMLGSISSLGRGNLNYLFTLVGIALSLIVTKQVYSLPVIEIESKTGSFFEYSFWPAYALIYAGLIIFGCVRLMRGRNSAIAYLFATGAFGALLFAVNPYWSYLASIGRGLNGELFSQTPIADTAAITLFLGATFSAWLRSRLDLCWPNFWRSSGSLIGGLLMGLGAQIAPGGNDTLLLWTIPGLAVYGALAYTAMTITTIAGMMLVDWLKSLRDKGGSDVWVS